MFEPILKQLRNAKRLKAEKIFVRIYSQQNVRTFIANANRDQLRYEFVNSDGVKLSSIGGDYSPVTIEISQAKGRPKTGSANVDLYDTGAFSRSIKVINVNGKGFTIKANTVKDGEDLTSQWGDKILGLTAESLEDLMELVLPMWRELTLKDIQDGTI